MAQRKILGNILMPSKVGFRKATLSAYLGKMLLGVEGHGGCVHVMF